MRKIVAILTLLALLTALAVPAMAADVPRLVDDAGLFSSSEERSLTELLDEVSEEWDVDVVLVTADDLEGASSTAYADDFFDYGGYGYDGILWLIDMDNRKSTISTCGSCIEVFTDAGQEYMQDQLAPMLTDEEYYEAGELFVELCDDYLRQAEEGEPYDVGNLPDDEFDPVFSAVIALVVGLLAALIVTAVFKGQLKSVRSQAAASSYLRRDSLQLTESRDLYLYRNISRVEKPKDSGGSSTHTSSSGRSHGGSSRGF